MIFRQNLRLSIRSKRASLSELVRNEISHKIASSVISLVLFRSSLKIACYMPFDGEVETSLIITKILQSKKSCYLPCVKNGKMIFMKYEKDSQLKKNAFGILEPIFNQEKSIEPSELDLVIAPVVGFDKNANRLGMGGGYYDAAFALKTKRINKFPYLIGIGYEFQKIDLIPIKDTDVPMDMIITEEHCYP